jgi:hypothetical protein
MKGGLDLIQPHQDLDFAVNLPPGGALATIAFDASVAGRLAAFANHTQGAVRTYWTFGDRHVSHQSDPAHEYGDGGAYTVTLRATGDGAAMSVLSRRVAIAGGRAEPVRSGCTRGVVCRLHRGDRRSAAGVGAQLGSRQWRPRACGDSGVRAAILL